MNRRTSSPFRRGQRIRRSGVAEVATELERARGFDRAIELLQRTAKRTLRRGTVRDVLNGVPFGHPVHAPLTDVPIGAWTSAAILDTLPGDNRRTAGTLVAVGLAGAIPTALTGWADWSTLHRQQQRVGLVHALATGTASILYSASLVARIRGRASTGAALGYAGLGTLMVGGYLGGHLAFRQAAGASHADQVDHLIPLGWHDIGAFSELPDGWPVQRRLGYISLFVLRSGDDVHVLTDRCSHLAGPLHQGRIVRNIEDDVCVVCPWHGSTFRTRDGAVVHGPATAPQPAFETRVSEDGTVQVRPAN